MPARAVEPRARSLILSRRCAAGAGAASRRRPDWPAVAISLASQSASACRAAIRRGRLSIAACKTPRSSPSPRLSAWCVIVIELLVGWHRHRLQVCPWTDSLNSIRNLAYGERSRSSPRPTRSGSGFASVNGCMREEGLLYLSECLPPGDGRERCIESKTLPIQPQGCLPCPSSPWRICSAAHVVYHQSRRNRSSGRSTEIAVKTCSGWFPSCAGLSCDDPRTRARTAGVPAARR